jgi:amino acid adenylation domain-containing protein
MADLKDRIDKLPAEKRRLLELLRARQEGARDTPPPITRKGHRRCRLSFAQERLWFFDQMEPDSPAYNIPVALRLKGRLDADALAGTLDELVARHESLRTRFDLEQGEAVQLIEPGRGVPPASENLEEVEAGEREAEVLRRAEAEALRPFDLSRGHLFRATLLRLSAEEHVLLLNMHHIVSDGWSVSVLIGELAALYAAFAEGRPSPLPELKVQYADYAVWQRDWLRGDFLERQLGYWREHLADLPPLAFPTDRPRPAVRSYRGACEVLRLDTRLTRGLRALSREEGATLFMTLLAASQVVLGRWAGADEFPVGTAIANRDRTEIEGLVGFFVNTLVIRADLSGQPSFRQLLRRVRDVTLEAYAHHDVPFERLVEALAPERDLSRTPLFDVMCSLNSVPERELSLPGLTLSRIPLGQSTSKFDLSLVFEESGEDVLVGKLTYSTDLFDAATIRRLLGHLSRVFEQVAADPERRVEDLELLTEGERRQLLLDWNRTAQAFPSGRCSHELFEEQARRTPTVTAVICGGHSLTYDELNRAANRLAHRLRRSGVTAESRVAVFLERSVEVAVGLLAILKAGGVYMPFDPGYPRERLGWMLRDAGAAAIVTREALLRLLPDTPGAHVLCLDESAGGPESESDPAPAVTPANSSYLIYTSGSTGRPKGVLVGHASLLNTLLYGRDAFAFNAGDVMAVLASFSFDISLLELMTPWMAGAASLIFSREESLNTELFNERLGQVSVMLAVPSHLRLILAGLGDNGGALLPLRRVLTGGELIPPDLLRDVNETFPNAEINVLYGPTETTLICADMVVPRHAKVTKPLVGLPIANTQLYVLDPNLRPVPVGVAGELYVGGAGLAHGYLNRPDLTAERFVPNPFASTPGEKLYRTGDVGRFNAEGVIEFVGRTDQQVKIRGYRIEPAEVDAACAEHSSVRACVTTVRNGKGGEPQLVTYAVLDDPACTVSDLSEWLKSKLPAYMIPAAILRVERIPTTANGKVDYGSLPAPNFERRAAGVAHTPARNSLEESIAALWAEVLHVERVGVLDNFFDIGGHSLLLARLRITLCETFGCRLSMVDMFTHPTVSAMAQHVAGLKAEPDAAPDAPSAGNIESGRELARRLQKRRRPAAEA